MIACKSGGMSQTRYVSQDFGHHLFATFLAVFFQIRENIECEIFGSLLEEAKDSYKEEIIHELQSETVDQMHANVDYVCRLASEWRPAR